MKAYTDNFTVRADGIYRIERIYHPGGEWERKEVLWLPREAVEAAHALWTEHTEDDGK